MLEKTYEDKTIQLYLGDSLEADLLIIPKSCQGIYFTPYAPKNLDTHYPDMKYQNYLDMVISKFSGMLTDTGHFCVCCLPYEKTDLAKAFVAAGFQYAQEYAIDVDKLNEKTSMTATNTYKKNFYIVFSKVKLPGVLNPSDWHPKELLRQIVFLLTREGDLIFHPFMNTAKPVRISFELGRRCIGISDAQDFCDIAAKRLTDQDTEERFSRGLK